VWSLLFGLEIEGFCVENTNFREAWSSPWFPDPRVPTSDVPGGGN